MRLNLPKRSITAQWTLGNRINEWTFQLLSLIGSTTRIAVAFTDDFRLGPVGQVDVAFVRPEITLETQHLPALNHLESYPFLPAVRERRNGIGWERQRD